jgi:hypothetical protein
MGCTEGLVTCFSHCLMMDIFSDSSKQLGLLETEDASKALIVNNSNSFILDTGRHNPKTSNFNNTAPRRRDRVNVASIIQPVKRPLIIVLFLNTPFLHCR